MPTRAALVAGGLVVACLGTGCANSTEDYCGALEEQRTALTDLAGDASRSQTDVFGQSLEIFEQLRDQAPTGIRDEWDTYVFAWENVADAFETAGVTPQEYRPGGESSPEVSEAEARAIEDAAGELASPRVVDAGDGIEQHAADVCKVDLGL